MVAVAWWYVGVLIGCPIAAPMLYMSLSDKGWPDQLAWAISAVVFTAPLWAGGLLVYFG